ncbi:TetR/AcrR family transcriptional regulator [Cryptosporangium sp. NPDC048952]|uniref:TetR/AcrR family transcriptional regulator n=1 Tax=Cryptosporangium sp. NPDC048952 TaxID=3363961 RepID=UPI00371C77C8
MSATLLPRRLDARRNREVILRVAVEAFDRCGELVSLDEIARRAGLGRATVYRHFPDRNALGSAVAAERLADLARRMESASFREFLHATLVEQRSLVGLLRELPERAQRRYSDALLTLLRPAFRRAREEGRLRSDLELADLPIVFGMVESATERLVQALLDGLFEKAA